MGLQTINLQTIDFIILNSNVFTIDVQFSGPALRRPYIKLNRNSVQALSALASTGLMLRNGINPVDFSFISARTRPLHHAESGVGLSEIPFLK